MKTRRTIEVMGRRLRYEYDDWTGAQAVELTPMPGRSEIRIPLEMLRELHANCRNLSIRISWEGRQPSVFGVAELTAWPACTTYKLISRRAELDVHAAWVGLEAEPGRPPDTGSVIVRMPRLDKRAAVETELLPAALLSPEVLRFKPWKTIVRPHLWPDYQLYADASGEPILYIFGGLAHGRFKLAKMQLDEFLALEALAPLHLGFQNLEQGIDVAIPLKALRLPRLENVERSDPYYLIDVSEARKRALSNQLCLPI